jgi:exopolyphosphatase/guanosine-5'-triphosphate,3'-diphosphate pyrophosphatase
MRFAVLDIGGHSTCLDIVDLVPGLPPQQVTTLKQPVRLAEATGADGMIAPAAVEQLVAAVGKAVATAAAHRVDSLYPYVTAAVRDAANGADVLDRVRAGCGVDLGTMSGEEDARLTFLAARRWYGWSAGPLLLLDIGGGSMEIAHGPGETPSYAVSLPLGAGRLTRSHLPRDTPYGKGELRALRRHVRSVLTEPVAALAGQETPMLRAATSRVFAQLARLTAEPGAAAGQEGTRTLDRQALHRWIPRLAAITVAERAGLPGVTRARGRQILAGAVVAETAMRCLGVERLAICPWGLREGIFQTALDRLTVGERPLAGRDRVAPPPTAAATRIATRVPRAGRPPVLPRESRTRLSGV